MDRGDGFKGRQFTAEVILWAVRWYLMFPISYRDLELMLLDRGVEVDHTTIFRWIQAYAAELEKANPPAFANEQRLLAGGRNLPSGEGTLDISLSGGGQPRADDRFPSVCAAGYGRGEAVLSQGHRATACRQSAHSHRRQESCLSQSGRRYEKRRSAMAPHLSATDVFDKAFPNRHGGEFLLETRAQRF